MNRQMVHIANPLKIKAIAWPVGDEERIQGELKMQVSPRMLLKTHVEKMSLRGHPRMLMKTSQLFPGGQNVHENKEGYRPHGAIASSRRR